MEDGNQKRQKARNARQRLQDGAMGDRDTTGVVQVPAGFSVKSEDAERLRMLGYNFGDESDSGPAEKPKDPNESVGQEDNDLNSESGVLSQLIGLVEKIETTDHENDDHNDEPDKAPVQEKNEMSAQDAHLSISELRAQQRGQRRLEREAQREEHQEYRKTSAEEAEEVFQLREEKARAEADNMPELAQKIQKDIDFNLENPETRAVVEKKDEELRLEEERVVKDALREAKRTENQDYETRRLTAIKEIGRVMAEEPKGTDSIFEVGRRLYENHDASVKLRLPMGHGEEVLLRVFWTPAPGRGGHTNKKFEPLVATPGIPLPQPSTDEDRREDWKHRGFVPNKNSNFVWPNPEMRAKDPYNHIKEQLAAVDKRQKARHNETRRVNDASEGAELSLHQLLVEGMPGKSHKDRVIFQPKSKAEDREQHTAVVDLVLARHTDMEPAELTVDDVEGTFLPITIPAWRPFGGKFSLFTMHEEGLVLYVHASVSPRIENGEPVLHKDGVPMVRISTRVTQAQRPDFANRNEDFVKNWENNFPVHSTYLERIIFAGLLAEWRETHAPANETGSGVAEEMEAAVVAEAAEAMEQVVEDLGSETAETEDGKPHRHHWRVSGLCSCGEQKPVTSE